MFFLETLNIGSAAAAAAVTSLTVWTKISSWKFALCLLSIVLPVLKALLLLLLASAVKPAAAADGSELQHG